MKKISLLLVFSVISIISFSQITGGGGGVTSQPKAEKVVNVDSKNALSVTLSSYSLAVISYEYLFMDNISASVGVLPIGIEFTGQYHFKTQLMGSGVGLRLGFDKNLITKYSSLPKFGVFYQFTGNRILTFRAEGGVHKYTYLDDYDIYGYTIQDKYKGGGFYLDIRLGVYFPW